MLKKTDLIFKTLKKIFISWHNPDRNLILASFFLCAGTTRLWKRSNTDLQSVGHSATLDTIKIVENIFLNFQIKIIQQLCLQTILTVFKPFWLCAKAGEYESKNQIYVMLQRVVIA